MSFARQEQRRCSAASQKGLSIRSGGGRLPWQWHGDCMLPVVMMIPVTLHVQFREWHQGPEECAHIVIKLSPGTTLFLPITVVRVAAAVAFVAGWGAGLSEPTFCCGPIVSLQAAANSKHLLISLQTAGNKAGNLPWVRDVPALNLRYCGESDLWQQSSCGSSQWAGAKESPMGATGLGHLQSETDHSGWAWREKLGRSSSFVSHTWYNYRSETFWMHSPDPGCAAGNEQASASVPGLPCSAPEVWLHLLPSRNQGKWIQGMCLKTSFRNGSCCWTLVGVLYFTIWASLWPSEYLGCPLAGRLPHQEAKHG